MISRLSRRQFLQFLGAVGGSTAVFGAFNALGMASGSSGPKAPPVLEGDVRGVKVLILGAGPAGLTAAYELCQVGYNVQVLEARGRVGGHVFTVRNGTVSEEIGTKPQRAEYSPGQYFNAGAWRIPYYHRATLYYPRIFGIPMIPHINVNHQAYSYLTNVPGQSGARKLPIREIFGDMAGYTSEILAKAIDQQELDLDFSENDQEAIVQYLIQEGVLSSNDLSYGPNDSRGWEVPPGPGEQPGIPSTPLPFEDIIQFGAATAQQMGIFNRLAPLMEMQSTMQTAANGMQEIYEKGFLPRLRNKVKFNAEVLKIAQFPDGMWVDYRDKETGREERYYADYCISTIPLSVLKDIPADFSPLFKEAILAGSNYASVGKIGLQFKRRFWEEDEWIYGGITFTDMQDIGSLSYPMYGFLTEKGVIQGYYNFGTQATQVGDLEPKARTDLALEGGAKIHGSTYIDEFETGFSVSWDRVRYSNGAWSGWSSEAREKFYPVILEPDGRVYIAGEMASYDPGWQQGAISAAWMQIQKLHERVIATHTPSSE